jgi:hypothetical protein
MIKNGQTQEENNEVVLRDRATRLFKFLKELALLKTKVIRDLADYEKVVWLCDVPEYHGCLSVLGLESDKLQDSSWLEIKQSAEPPKPSVPTLCHKWIADNDLTPLNESSLNVRL